MGYEMRSGLTEYDKGNIDGYRVGRDFGYKEGFEEGKKSHNWEEEIIYRMKEIIEDYEGR